MALEYIGEHEVYDIETEQYHTLLVNGIAVHNCQDLNWEFLPIIRECMSASSWGYEQYTGTPKTFDNTIQVLWEESSQAEWVIRCGCGFYNVPAQGHHVHKMIGPAENIAKYGTALICARCGRPINAEKGVWVHRYQDRRVEFAGYHVSQIIMWMHYADEKKWTELLQKRDKVAPAVYLNEVLGESCDVGTKLVTRDELINSCQLPWRNTFNDARDVRMIERYIQRILGVDWGGGGLDEVSYTTLSVVGMRWDGRLEMIYGERLHSAVSDVDEVARILELFRIFQCKFLAHDFCGSGSVHETLLIQAGMPLQRILPMAYVFAPTRNVIYLQAPETHGSRSYYGLDKARSLAITCSLIKTRHLLFPTWDSTKNLLEDFLHLVEDKIARPGKGDIMRIVKQPKTADDFAHSTSYAAWGHFRTTGKYPSVASSFGLRAAEKGAVEKQIQQSIQQHMEQKRMPDPGSGVDFDLT